MEGTHPITLLNLNKPSIWEIMVIKSLLHVSVTNKFKIQYFKIHISMVHFQKPTSGHENTVIYSTTKTKVNFIYKHRILPGSLT